MLIHITLFLGKKGEEGLLPTAEDFQEELNRILLSSRWKGMPYVDVESGYLHQQAGHYPNRNHRMPICCRVMKSNMKEGDRILQQPPSGQGASLIIRYRLPR